MVVLTTKEGKNYYVDDRLYIKFIKNVIKTINKKDEDFVLVVDGKERSGKSVFAMQMAKSIDPSFCLDRLCFSADDFEEKIKNASKGQAVVLDEAYRHLSSSGALSEVNRLLKSLMMEMGQKNLFVIIVLPTFYLLDRYVAIWRAKALINIYKTKKTKGCWKLYNGKKITRLYNNPKNRTSYNYDKVKTFFKGRFYNQYVLNEEEYRLKKEKNFKDSGKVKKPDKYMEQRDAAIGLLYNQGLTHKEITKGLNGMGITLSRQLIAVIAAKFKGKKGVNSNSKNKNII